MHLFVYRCYARALKLLPEVPQLWYDLGLNYYHQACLPYPTEGAQNSQSLLLEKAQQVPHWPYTTILQHLCNKCSPKLFFSSQCLKKAIMMDSGNHICWNALGVVSMNKGKYALSCKQ